MQVIFDFDEKFVVAVLYYKNSQVQLETTADWSNLM